MPEINISVSNKIPRVQGSPCVVCGNSDYRITFAFDSEWDAYNTKTARFSYTREGEPGYIDVVFTGQTVNVPVLSGVYRVRVGVYAGDLHTTTPAIIPCKLSVLCEDGAPEEPPENVYNQIMELLNTGGNVVTDEQIASAVEAYLEENPVSGTVELDTTLTESGKAADAAAVGAALESLVGGGTTITEETVALTDMTGYLLKSSGNVVASSAGNVNRVVSEPVYANAGESYLFTCSANYGNALYVIYGSSGEALSYVIADATEAGNVLTREEIEMPENTCYFRLAANLDNMPSGYEAVKVVETTTTTAISRKWLGKKWVCIGDSLTEKNSKTTMNYHDYIAQETGVTVVNMGVGGTGYVNGYDTEEAFYQRIANVPTDADVVTIFGSGNDLSTMESLGLSMGAGDAVSGDESPTTVAGYVANAIQALHDILPTVQFGIISPTPWQYHYPMESDDSMTEYADMLKNVCEQRGIPFLDLYRCSGLRPWEESFRELAYSKDDGVGTHPDETGHAIIAPRIKAFLETLLM